MHAAPAAQTDKVLLALLTLAREDARAGRLVLQAILPALKKQAERINKRRGRRDEVWELLLFYAWQSICAYPLRRGSRVAANLVLQVLHDTTRELYHPHSHREQPLSDHDLDELLTRNSCPDVDGCEPPNMEGSVMDALVARVIGERDAELILKSRIDGVRLRLLARASGVSYHALRQRRQRAEAQLRLLLETTGDVSKSRPLDLTSLAQPFCSPPRAGDRGRSRHARRAA